MADVVIDANVLISGLLKGGTPRRIYLAFKRGEFNLILSSTMFEEIMHVLGCRKFQNLINSEERKELAYFLQTKAKFVTPIESISICREPEDDHILACAVEAKADSIVTGDKDLLVLNPFRDISILTPAKFLKLLRK